MERRKGVQTKQVAPTCSSSSSVGFALSCLLALTAASNSADGMVAGRGEIDTEGEADKERCVCLITDHRIWCDSDSGSGSMKSVEVDLGK
jgi:hypothetical protein